MGCPPPARGASWPTRVPEKTASKSSDSGSLSFSVFTYAPIELYTAKGREEFVVPNPPYVQLPLIKNVVEHLQNKSICTCDCVSATSVNWVVDRILGKL